MAGLISVSNSDVEAAARPASRLFSAGVPPRQAAPPGESGKLLVSGKGTPRAGPRRVQPMTGFETVIGDDERQAVTESDRDPWRRICQLDLIGPRGVFKGTGWFAGPATVVTAGHCVHYPTFFRGWAEKIAVSPGRHMDARPFEPVEAMVFSSVNEWLEGQAADFDIGCIHLDTPLGLETGAFSFASLPDGDLEGMQVNVSGYPTDKDRAKVQYHHANTILKTTPRRIFYDVDTASGQSGAPVLLYEEENAEPLVVAIHAYGVPGTPMEFNIVSNSAPRINAEVFELIERWAHADNERLGLTPH